MCIKLNLSCSDHYETWLRGFQSNIIKIHINNSFQVRPIQLFKVWGNTKYKERPLFDLLDLLYVANALLHSFHLLE